MVQFHLFYRHGILSFWHFLTLSPNLPFSFNQEFHVFSVEYIQWYRKKKKYITLYYNLKPLSLAGNVIFITFQHFQRTSMLSVFSSGGFLYIYLFCRWKKRGEKEMLLHAIWSAKLNCCHSWYLILTLQVLSKKDLSSGSYWAYAPVTARLMLLSYKNVTIVAMGFLIHLIRFFPV